jgi:hypothetical protein
MSPDTSVQLGSFVFRETEVPEKIPWGGKQKCAVHELVGGMRQVDAMGRAEKDLAWSGLILGPDAMDRALQLDTLRAQGNALPLAWGRLSYLVVIEEFEPVYERYYQIPYHINCLVVANNTTPASQPDNSNIDDAVSDDMTSAGGLAPSIGDSTLTSLWGAFSTAVGAISTFANAAGSLIAPLVQSLAAVQAQVLVLTAAAEGVILGAGAIGMLGTIPGTTVSDMSAAIEALEQMQALAALAGYLGRIEANFGAVSQSGSTVVTAGGDLFKIAAANALADPLIQGVQALQVPSAPDGNDGVLES